MVDAEIMHSIKRCLSALPAIGIHPTRAILFGSCAAGRATEWSDIDLIVIAPEFDDTYDWSVVEELWAATASVDVRIEPIPCGEKEWETDGGRPILEIARREGIEIAA